MDTEGIGLEDLEIIGKLFETLEFAVRDFETLMDKMDTRREESDSRDVRNKMIEAECQMIPIYSRLTVCTAYVGKIKKELTDKLNGGIKS